MYWTQERLRSHYTHPHNKGVVEGANLNSRLSNPSCGDVSFFSARIEEGVIQHVMFEGEGCVISIATSSLLTDVIRGKTVDEVLAYDAQFICSLLEMQLGPVRIRCALLPLQTLQEGIRNYNARTLDINRS